MLFKTDSLGDTLWVKTYGSTSGAQECTSVIALQDGNNILAGYTSSPNLSSGGGDMWIIKTDSIGDTLWSKSYGGIGDERGYKIIPTNDTGFISVGTTGSFSAGNLDIYVVKINSSGTLQWAKSFGTSEFEYGYDVKQTNDGGYIIVGNQQIQSNGISYIFALKISSQGNLIWAKEYGTPSQQDIGFSVEKDKYDFVIGCGVYGNSVPEGLLLKIDTTGNLIWKRGYVNLPNCYTVVKTIDKGFVFSSTGDFSNAGLVAKTDSLGFPLWFTYIQDYSGSSSNVIETHDGGYATIGSGPQFGVKAPIINSFGGYTIIFSKLDSAGQTPCSNYPAPLIDTSFQLATSNFALSSSSGGQVKNTYPNVTQSYFSLMDTICVPMLPGAVNEINIDALTLLVPNPTNGIFNIKSFVKILNIEILNPLGEKIYPPAGRAGSNPFTQSAIDISSQPNGVYFIHIISKEGTAVKKLVINH